MRKFITTQADQDGGYGWSILFAKRDNLRQTGLASDKGKRTGAQARGLRPGSFAIAPILILISLLPDPGFQFSATELINPTIWKRSAAVVRFGVVITVEFQPIFRNRTGTSFVFNQY
ncbi:MAG: hypothetical protein IPG76_01730 [Acidobacteria bacterium]|nr:hypothetical protein [Acidobacteriota bacterium]